LAVTRVHQAWVGDITYIATEEGFVYLALLTDVFSRFIVGFDLSSSLAVEGCARALEQAIAQANRSDLGGLIHHSDHGVQYTAWPYRERLQKMGMLSSMGEVGNCYENPLAERVNGILKSEYGLDDLFIDKEHAQRAVREDVWLYNYERPHLSLNYCKPAEIYFGR
jgi:putative transposase